MSSLKHFHRIVWVFTAVGIAFASETVEAGGQDKPRLTMTLSSKVVSPGSTLSVTLASPSGESFEALAVIGTGSIGIKVVEKLPATISFAIPADASFGKQGLTAMTVGAEVEAHQEFEIMRSDLPTKFRPDFPSIGYPYEQGGTPNIALIAEFADGSEFRVTESSAVSYSSTNPKIAIAHEYGSVLLIGAGECSIVATYTAPSGKSIKTIIPVTVPEPRFKATPTSLEFGSHPLGTPVTREIVLTNSTQDPLTISNVAAFPWFVETNTCVSASPIASGRSCQVTVTFTAEQAGAQDGLLRITDDAGDLGYRLYGVGVLASQKKEP
jgi:Protein of unknown function (DUF1573)